MVTIVDVDQMDHGDEDEPCLHCALGPIVNALANAMCGSLEETAMHVAAVLADVMLSVENDTDRAALLETALVTIRQRVDHHSGGDSSLPTATNEGGTA